MKNMNYTSCDQALQDMDAYVSRQLPDENAGGLQEHFGQCAACSEELEVRQFMRDRLRAAVQDTATPPYLEARIRNMIRTDRRPSIWNQRLAAVAATVLVCLGGVVAYHLGHLRFTTESQESYISSVANRVPALMRVGLRDHIHCAVFRKYPKNAPKTEEFLAKLGPGNSELISIVRKQVPQEYRIMVGHKCDHRGRTFVHLSLKSDSKLLSLVITRKEAGESFLTEEMIPAVVQSAIPIYRAGVQRFQIASFETRDHLAYVVSDLSEQENTNIMLALAPQVKQVLDTL
jgi:hypothetical protein